MKRVVITGLGAITPLGNNVDTFWNNAIQGQSGAGAITHFDATNFKTKFACEVKGFDPLDYFTKPEARKMDLFTQYAIAASEECLADAQLDRDTVNRQRIGAIIATGIGGLETLEEEILNFGKDTSQPKFNPFFITKMISNMAAGQISIRFGLKGISYAVASACAAANNAIGSAFDAIRLGRADAILAGGTEATICQSAIAGFNAMKALSTANEDPAQASRPFDANRTGFVAGEGAGILLLEELEHAQKRGAKIYCELVGYGSASDAYHVAATHPEGEGAIAAMQQALEDAKLTTHAVDYINAHATSTPVGDISECKAIEQLFKDNLGHLNISATKSMTGHLLGAAGAIESILCIKSITEGIIPPTINLTTLDSAISSALNLTPHVAQHKTVDVAMNNTFGFGGHTSSVIFKRFTE
ncbi:beta-ketoacyl-ACP synthase II [Myroides odoratus]|uniref:3-oxoacyl-[acyl-carrier-protein] synthase 2 n=1 Tax=Myroides odoratus TaxID=256 RepID=A0A378U4K1_MYROD|nr:beta-ketoacyl-ACP synthase II [Myroides odoratus]QQU02563.1 beta-ketoacyl-ACP synthase II [Myroides odoratus]STZ70225.1 3-oxoacyl-[acyl-carrier-protein] synthase 2 [Myroides odoratus]